MSKKLLDLEGLEKLVDKLKDYADSAGGGDESVIIRTQAEFNTLINSPSWLDATSIVFAGEFTHSGSIQIPQTVKKISGTNAAKITITNAHSGLGAFYYSSFNSGSILSNIIFECSSESSSTSVTGLKNFETVVSCKVYASSRTLAHAFSGCTNIVYCYGEAQAFNSRLVSAAAVFVSCERVVGSEGVATLNNIELSSTTGEGRAIVFLSCDTISDCKGQSLALGSDSAAFGARHCDYVSNVEIDVSKTNNPGELENNTVSYGFRDCKNMSNTVVNAQSEYGAAMCYWECINLTNCNGVASGSMGAVFYGCNGMTNCTKSGESALDVWWNNNENVDPDTCPEFREKFPDLANVKGSEIKNLVTEAPDDGKQYARQNKGWAEVVGVEVIDSLNSTSTTAALSANQGRVLNNKIDAAIQAAIQNTWNGEY
ncbi:MAG TPA: hypothetical protein GX745_01860 [Clostridiales bacterium]|nr:hypothetical protein [Clostridiales bacterium]